MPNAHRLPGNGVPANGRGEFKIDFHRCQLHIDNQCGLRPTF
jgi:hypothetical protein